MLLKDKDVLIFMGDSVTDADRVKPDGEGLFNAYGFGYVNMINNGGSSEQVQGLIALMIPVIALYVLYKVVMGIVHKFLYRKGEW